MFSVSASKLCILIGVFFLTSVVSVVTGSTSLITVPVMIALGIEAHIAVATNMLGLPFMSLGGSLPFIGKGVVRSNRLLRLIVLTIVGSGLGALLLLNVPLKTLPNRDSRGNVAVAGFSVFNGDLAKGILKMDIQAFETLRATCCLFYWQDTGAFQRRLRDHADSRLCPAFSSDVFASGGDDKSHQCVFIRHRNRNIHPARIG